LTDELFARAQMGVSLAFHILFAVAGIAMPVLMVAAEALWYRTGEKAYGELSLRWAKGTAVLFAVGAVSGTVLSFELGLLFPRFMQHAGPVIGMPFSLEGIAFFTEAIFLGIVLYGRDRVPRALHLASGVVVCLSGLASAVFVLFANAWMNAPRGFRVEDGRFLDIDPVAAMTTPFAVHEVLHMVAAAYMATGFAVAGIHAWALLRGAPAGFHRRALGLGLWLAIPFTLRQPLIGDYSGKQVARYQPLKLAAMEGLERTRSHAPLRLGPVEIPGALSWIAHGDAAAVVRGLEEWPERDRPPSAVMYSFRGMVATGMLLAAIAAWAILLRLRKRPWDEDRLLLKVLALAAPLGFLAIELGWVVTEVGRQPWVIYGVMRTAESITPMPGLVVPFVLFSVVYAGLAVAVIAILRSQVRATMEPRQGPA
jgi:cytochrome d ubiquinol oxidase subunit I